MMLKRISALAAVLLPFAACVRADTESLAAIFTNSVPPHHSAIPRRSSIVVIACRGLALGDLSAYGQTNFQTPNLDRLAADGIRFTQYSAAADDLTGALAALVDGKPGASAGQTTVVERLHKAGYYTGLLGEWTLGSEPWKQGFDEFHGYYNDQDAANFYSDFVWRYDVHGRFDTTNKVFLPLYKREELYPNMGGKKGWYMPDVYMNAAGNFIRGHVPDFASRYRPFFLLVDMPIPHSVTPGKDDYPVPTDAPYTDEPWPQAARNRAALLTRLDNDVGRLLDQVEKVGMTNNLAIFFCGLGAPEKFANTNLNFLKVKGEVRGGDSEKRLLAPMIVHWPGHVPAGRVSATPWNATDLAPTFLQIGYAQPSGDFAGISMLPLLMGQQADATGAPERHSP